MVYKVKKQFKFPFLQTFQVLNIKIKYKKTKLPFPFHFPFHFQRLHYALCTMHQWTPFFLPPSNNKNTPVREWA